MAGYGFWQGVERATANLPSTIMKLMDSKMVLDKYAREQALFNEQEKQDNAIVAASAFYPDIKTDANTRDYFVKTAQAAGYKIQETEDGDIYAPVSAYKFVKKMSDTGAEFRIAALKRKAMDAKGKPILENNTATEPERTTTITPPPKPDAAQLTAYGARRAAFEMVEPEIEQTARRIAKEESEKYKKASNGTDIDMLLRTPEAQNKINETVASKEFEVYKYIRDQEITQFDRAFDKEWANREAQRKEEQQTPNEIKLITQDLRNTLKREPTAGEIIKHQQDIKNRAAGVPENIGKIGTTPPGVKNEDALNNLTPGQAQVVKQLVDYKINLPSGMALRTPYWQGILERASLYDTSFDATQYNVRLAVKKDFTSGKSANNIKSLNTAVDHLKTLSDAGKELENGSVQLWNKISNYGLTQVGDSRVTKFNNAATAIENELANVFKSIGATDQEIKAWRENINSSQSPKQLKENIEIVIKLLSGRLSALQNQYEVGLGKPKDFRFLSPKSRIILKGLRIDVDSIDPVAGGGQQPSGNLLSKPPLTPAQALEELRRRGKI